MENKIHALYPVYLCVFVRRPCTSGLDHARNLRPRSATSARVFIARRHTERVVVSKDDYNSAGERDAFQMREHFPGVLIKSSKVRLEQSLLACTLRQAPSVLWAPRKLGNRQSCRTHQLAARTQIRGAPQPAR